jgi:cell division protein FtsW
MSLGHTPVSLAEDWRDSKAYLQLLLLVLSLVGFGLVMVYSASSGLAQFRFDNGHFFIQRWVLRAMVGVVALLLAMYINLERVREYAQAILVFAFVCLAIVIVMKVLGIGKVRGAYRWIPIPGFGAFQPADLMRLALVVYLAESLNRDQGAIFEFKNYLRHAAVVAAAMFLIILQPDLGTALAIGMTCALMMYVAGVRVVHLMASALSALPFIAFIVFGLGYRKERVMTFLNPTGDVQGDGYQISQSLVALGSGGWTGLGLTQSLQKYFFLPEPHTDFVFSIVGEELGMVGTLSLLAGFCVFGHLGLKVAREAPSFHRFLLASGLTFMVMVYALINIGVSIGLLPTTGLPLPFISYGGSSLLLTLIATGLLINVGRTNHLGRGGILIESPVRMVKRPRSRIRQPVLARRS